jgi:hypothetical protein
MNRTNAAQVPPKCTSPLLSHTALRSRGQLCRAHVRAQLCSDEVRP